MAGPADVVERSMSINAKFLPRLEAAVEQNALLRIGWTGSGEEVPKNGEVGLCPAMPEGARIRALGKLGSWTSPSDLAASSTSRERQVRFLEHTTTVEKFQPLALLDDVLDL